MCRCRLQYHRHGRRQSSSTTPLSIQHKRNGAYGRSKGVWCITMAKFILSVGDGTFKILASEARRRDVTVQQLLRAVIVPEWVRENVEENPSMVPREVAPHLMRQSIYPGQRDQMLQIPVNRLRP